MNAAEFGSYLKSLRTAQELTLSQLGEIIGYSNPYLSQIENGKKGIPSPELLKKMAEPLGVGYPQLLKQAGILPSELEETAKTMDEIKATYSEYEKASHNLLAANDAYEKATNELEQAEHELKALEDFGQNPPLDLIDFLNFPFITYKEKALTDKERQRILDMLAIMFPDYK
ncbi:helix-turn-helix domain-containing protein [Brevibacillus sp. RS1.1]|uniref:helix-turn-helix domain-containing protein n=1 Tax=Brevibacillus sp. RS1.1 TaxID=2738982 RepID=UPI00156AD08C|nr:helix-turn-helix transcriptional regulator [Brevibacillus sp. RS1.1]NRR04563.1 helix-turn-helix domain-containing protein [Brevibacillus sp. RS1.1]